MALAAGTRLGRYEIHSLVGRGGMGEVYLAQDTKLERTIAIKILLADEARDQARRRRFVQEARAASALNHPNVAHIYEVGEENGLQFIAMEYVEGQTLRQRMAETRLNLDEEIEIATQVADALAAAHASGIVHRDIKPENVMVRRDGYVKVLDFGLAKLAEKSSQPVHDPGAPNADRYGARLPLRRSNAASRPGVASAQAVPHLKTDALKLQLTGSPLGSPRRC